MSPTARFLRGGCRRFGLYALVVALFLLWPAFRDALALLGLYGVYTWLRDYEEKAEYRV